MNDISALHVPSTFVAFLAVVVRDFAFNPNKLFGVDHYVRVIGDSCVANDREITVLVVPNFALENVMRHGECRPNVHPPGVFGAFVLTAGNEAQDPH